MSCEHILDRHMNSRKLNKAREKWLRELHRTLIEQAEASGKSEARMTLSGGCSAVVEKRAGVWLLRFLL